MHRRFTLAAAVLAYASMLGAEEALYRIDLIPSGKAVSKDLPVLKGSSYLYHAYPTGTLVSVKKSSVKQISKMTPAAAEDIKTTRTVRIRDLPFQGPKSGSGRGGWTNIDRARSAAAAANAGTATRTASPPD
ncbi:MAG TPA: hypothetical protein VLG15_15580 [Thermoanaerobaculia bacterium]|nr:hypothetical protein [Thermoanaerobaculia bacterium]